jgi:DctM-like transporters.
MDPALIGLLVTVVTIGIFALGIPVSFGLGFVSVMFLLIFEGFGVTKVIADTFMEGLMEFTIVSIPMFIVMGMALHLSCWKRFIFSFRSLVK